MYKSVAILAWGISTLLSAAEIKYPEGTSENFKSEIKIALAALPANYLAQVKKPIEISEVSLSTDNFITNDLCDQGQEAKYGFVNRRINSYGLRISSKLVNLARNNHTKFSCMRGQTFRGFLFETIIHELTHIKDYAENISGRADFQRIVGVKSVTRNTRRAVMNSNQSGSPDNYEYVNLKESLAVNAQYLLLDPEFECRKPAIASYLSKQLGIALKGECQKNYKVLTQSSYLEDNYLNQTSLDPKQVYRIDYLFAGKGKALMSNWGHAMFRVVKCAPHRKVAGPECLKDVSHHLVLSYRAYMSDMNLSYVKGLRGEYPSQMFIFRFHEVQQEYTKFDLRDLYSVPLRLTPDQRKEFLDVAVERYWTYQGKYFFVDNNCGTEAQKHLAIALSDDQSRLVRSLTPSQMYQDIIKSKNNLTEETIDGLTRSELITKGYLIPSMFEEINEAFLFLKQKRLYPQENFSQFIQHSHGQERLKKYQEFFSKADISLEAKKITLMKVIYIERYITGKMVQELPKKAIKLMNKDPALKAEIMKMGGHLKSLSLQPWEVIDSRYGVPLNNEFDSQFSEFKEKRLEDMKTSVEEQLKSLNDLMSERYFGEEIAKIAAAREIKTFTTKVLIETSKIEVAD